MTTTPNRGDEPAMPCETWVETENGKRHQKHRGLTIREHFAGLAMHGLLEDTGRSGKYSDYAMDAVKFADALIAELTKK